MIGSLRGTLIEKGSLRVTVEVGGVGYEVQVPLSTYERLGEPGAEIRLLIHTHVREDTLALFGFRSDAERRVFQRLLGVTGVGTKTALALLSGIGVEDLLCAVRDRDPGVLQRVPGVGRKTAERLVVELGDRAGRLLEEISRPTGVLPGRPGSSREEVVSALVNLGYRRREAAQAVERQDRGRDVPFEVLLKEALRALSGP
ncbi:MAG: Holliday junction branch migration protein RuvA [Acidobacteria bacterium]|nr:Holliday junction branch migration protein RuvA [Acidobacteriota bacterium]